MANNTSFELRNNPEAEDYAVNLVMGAFFFAMRSCEFSKVPMLGRNFIIHLGGVRFFTSNYIEIPHHHPHLIELETYV